MMRVDYYQQIWMWGIAVGMQTLTWVEEDEDEKEEEQMEHLGPV